VENSLKNIALAAESIKGQTNNQKSNNHRISVSSVEFFLSAYQLSAFQLYQTTLFPVSGPASRSYCGLHLKSNFPAVAQTDDKPE